MAVAEAAFGVGGFVFREEPEADGELRAVEELAGEGDHVVLRCAQVEAYGGGRLGATGVGRGGCVSCH